MGQLKLELQRLISMSNSDRQKDVLRKTVQLAETFESEPHSFLRFGGD